jgi:hypothetical protein
VFSDFASERGAVDVVDEGPLARDLDDGKPFAVARLELGIPADVHLLEVEAQLRPRLFERRASPLAEVAALRRIENDLDCYG